MKKLLLLLVFSLSCTISSADETYIFEPDNIEILHYVWTSHSEIYYAAWEDNNWSKPKKLTDDTDNDSSPALALDKNGHPWIAWVSEDGISTSILSIYWNGKRWSLPSQIDDVDIYSDTLPVITIDNENTAWIAWCGSDGVDDDIYITRWQGKNWTPPEMVNSNDNYPDLEPAISIDNNGNLLLVWCGYSAGKYQLFYSEQKQGKWTEEKFLFSQSIPSSFPNFLYETDMNPKLLFSSLGIQHKSTWDGKDWSDPVQEQLLIPQDLFERLNMDIIGKGFIVWTENGITQGIKINPFPKKLITKNKHDIIARLKEILSSAAMADVESNKYIAFGDSITSGYGSSGEGYPPRLERRLDQGIGPSTVVNEGVGGETTIDGVNRIDGVLNSHNAKYILLLEEANDVTHEFSTETIIFNLGAMVDKSIAYGTTPFLATHTPRIDGWALHVEQDINPKRNIWLTMSILTMRDMN